MDDRKPANAGEGGKTATLGMDLHNDSGIESPRRAQTKNTSKMAKGRMDVWDKEHVLVVGRSDLGDQGSPIFVPDIHWSVRGRPLDLGSCERCHDRDHFSCFILPFRVSMLCKPRLTWLLVLFLSPFQHVLGLDTQVCVG